MLQYNEILLPSYSWVYCPFLLRRCALRVSHELATVQIPRRKAVLSRAESGIRCGTSSEQYGTDETESTTEKILRSSDDGVGNYEEECAWYLSLFCEQRLPGSLSNPSPATAWRYLEMDEMTLGCVFSDSWSDARTECRSRMSSSFPGTCPVRVMSPGGVL